MRISEEKRSQLTNYANTHNIRLDLASYCNTTKEINTVGRCLTIIDQAKEDYHYAKFSAPHDTKNRMKKFMSSIKGLSPDAIEDELLYYQQMEPLSSQVKTITDEVFAYIKAELKSAGIGKNREEVMLPLFIDELYDTEKLSTSTPEELEAIQDFLNTFTSGKIYPH